MTGSTPAAQTVPAVPPRRSRRRWLRSVLLLAFVVAAGFATVLAPLWLPRTGNDDDSIIAQERAQRLFRASWGMALPGTPDLANLPRRLAENGLTKGAPILMRIFKREFELELWMQRDGLFHRFATYPICRWSGQLGPKLQQGDHQAPEGFYTVDAKALNPNSRWYRSFDLGYPNAYDRALGRTGSLIMVHGGCASVGCFAMTNAQMDEIWRLVTAALDGGQKRFQVQVYPFRLSDDALARSAGHPAEAFWRTLKRGNDLFEASLLPPRVQVCQGRYSFEPAAVGLPPDSPIDNRCPAATPKS